MPACIDFMFVGIASNARAAINSDAQMRCDAMKAVNLFPISSANLRLTVFVALCCATMAQPALAKDRPLLEAGTERPSPGETRPSNDLVRVVLDAIDKNDVEQMNDCLADKGLKRVDYASLLRAVKIAAGAGRNLWFVRPSLNPYCNTLYGAHSFRYFLIEDQQTRSQHRYRLVFQNNGDFFSIYRRQSHGLNDIEAAGCIVDECRSARMSFDGEQYRPVRCSRLTWDDRREEVREPRRCGSDNWRDDQSSGLARPSGN